MKLYFLRHGIAIDRSDPGDDDKRPLTKVGRNRVNRVAHALARLDLDIQSVISSPLLRALQTAQIVAKTLQLEDRMVVEPLLSHGFDATALNQLLRPRQKDSSLLFVGHEPDFSRTICGLIGGGRLRLKKAGLARVDVVPGRPKSAELIWLVPPKVLSELGAPRPPARVA